MSDLSSKEYRRGIYFEHLTETGFLLSYRISYFQDPGIAWPDVAELEERIAAHVDGIELGGDLARDCAIEFLQSADQDEVTGAAYALATVHVNDEQGLNAAIDAFTKAPDDVVAYFIDAFKYAKHPQLAAKLTPLLSHERAILCAATAEILGYRREVDVKRLWPLLHHQDATVLGAVVTALVRMGDRSALPALENAIFEGGTPAQDWLLLLLWMGSQRALQALKQLCSATTTASPMGLMCLAMAGPRDAFDILASAAHQDELKLGAYAALGVFGDVRAIPSLLDALQSQDDAQRVVAAEALNLITAAGLMETILIEEHDDELAPEDVTGAPKAATKDVPAPKTREVQRVCTQQDQWKSWWQANAKRFTVAPRWRHGQAFSLKTCIDDLADPKRTAGERLQANMELLIRSGQPSTFESDGFVPQQSAAIKAWQTWWSREHSKFEKNPWPFVGL
ncbi:MAG: HEAT repeat domain-containing protein [Pseudomonadota bacterium]